MDISAACVLAVNPLGKILMVSRRDNPNDWGLPGGKRENGEEDPMKTAARETWEEARVHVSDMVLLYTRLGHGHYCATYLALEYDDREMGTGLEEGLAKWGDYREIMYGSFGVYNQKLLERFSKVKGALSRIVY